ncbi:hypothetical protein ACFWJ4_09960, partial [Kitasatospora sp. NPDC127067]|uniref:hypothetical protein n=1 Tax=Kitasatospora sp. NPDC127067 TaxID=3347126 RepID=UPI00365B8BF3
MPACLVGVFDQQWQQAQVVDRVALAATSVEPAAHEQIGRRGAPGRTPRGSSRAGGGERAPRGR